MMAKEIEALKSRLRRMCKCSVMSVGGLIKNARRCVTCDAILALEELEQRAR